MQYQICDVVDTLVARRPNALRSEVVDYPPFQVLRRITERNWLDAIVAAAPGAGITLPVAPSAVLVHEIDRAAFEHLLAACGGVPAAPAVTFCPGCGVRPAAVCECNMTGGA